MEKAGRATAKMIVNMIFAESNFYITITFEWIGTSSLLIFVVNHLRLLESCVEAEGYPLLRTKVLSFIAN